MAAKKIIFIDGRVNDIDALIAKWQGEGEVHILDGRSDGLVQMSSVLSSHSDLSGIHVVSHGSVGNLLLGCAVVNAGSLSGYQTTLQTIGQSLAPDGDVMLYGCNVGAGEIGQSFVDHLAMMVAANVAASADATGSADQADWELEVRSGTVDSTPLQGGEGANGDLSAIMVNVGWDAAVDHSDDATVLTLRDAIDLANTRSGADTITFSGPMSVGLSVDYGELMVNDTADDQLSIVGGGTVSIFGVTSHSANPVGRVMFVDEGSLAISGITFSSGRAVGGGVWTIGNGGGGLGAGGAIFINNAKVEISDSAFSNNSVAGGVGGGRYFSYVAAGTSGGGLQTNGNSAAFDGGNGGSGWSYEHAGDTAYGGTDGQGLASAANWLSFGATLGSSGAPGGLTGGMPGGAAGIGGGGGGGGGAPSSSPAGPGGNGGQGGAGGTFGGGGGGGQGGKGGTAGELLYGGLGGAGGNGGNGGWGGGGGGGGNGGTGGNIGHVHGGVSGNGGAGGAGGDGGFGGGGGKGGVGGGWGAGGYYTAAGQRGANGSAGRGGLFGGDGAVDYGGGGAGLGGAIFVNGGGELSITNSSFTSNSASGGASGGGTAEAGEGHGGAIFALGSVVIDASVTFGTGTSANGASTADANLNAPVSQTLPGSTASELIQGGAGNDTITALAGNDTIRGGAGDDTLSGGEGDDTLDGGSGTDTAVYSGARSGYVITQGAAGFTITSTADGADTLISVESAKFSDQTVILVTPDSTPPTVTTFNPTDEANGFAIGDDIIFTFSEAIQRGTGNMVLKTIADVTVATYNAASSSNLTVSGNTLTLNPTADLAYNTGYKVEFALGSVKDLAGNNFAGTTSYNFTTLLRIEGTPDADTLYGSQNADPIFGLAGNDVIHPGLGNDNIDGGEGTDAVNYLQLRGLYSLDATNSGWTVNGQEGLDTLTNVERLQFADKKLALDLGATQNSGQAVEFIGALAYPLAKDAGTFGLILGYFDQGYTLSSISDLAVNIGLTASLAGSGSNADLAKLVFRNVVGTEADAATTDMLVGFMDGRQASYTQGEFLAAVAGLELNQEHVGLVGLQLTGLEYV